MGVRCALCWRPRDASLTLSVHSLLLVDALQTYGPDFELLVASHKHVGYVNRHIRYVNVGNGADSDSSFA